MEGPRAKEMHLPWVEGPQTKEDAFGMGGGTSCHDPNPWNMNLDT